MDADSYKICELLFKMHLVVQMAKVHSLRSLHLSTLSWGSSIWLKSSAGRFQALEGIDGKVEHAQLLIASIA